jgi:hypothetical protein
LKVVLDIGPLHALRGVSRSCCAAQSSDCYIRLIRRPTSDAETLQLCTNAIGLFMIR